MILGLLFLFSVVVAGYLGTRVGEKMNGGYFLPAVLRKKPLQIDYDFIEKTDKEIFGIDKEIAELPGYSWEVKLDMLESIDYMTYMTVKKEKLKVTLLDETGDEVSCRWVSKNTDGDFHRGPKGEPVRRRTAEELEEAIQGTMAKLANEEIEKVKERNMLNDVVTKYNGTPVSPI